jgi:branched-chain amino acid transport system substrate-binding protein
MRHTRIGVRRVCVGGVVASLAACGGLLLGGPVGVSAAAKPPLVIGISMSLSGDFSPLAAPQLNGYRLWAQTVNAHGGILGRQVVLKVADDASNPTQAVSNYQNFISGDHVDLVFGPFSSLLTIPTAPIAKRYGYAFVEPSGGSPTIFSEHLNNVFFTQPAPILSSGNEFANYILSLPAKNRPKTAAYPTVDDPFTSPIVTQVRNRLQAAGIKTVYSKTYSTETVDLSPVVAGIVAAKPDLIVSGTGGADAVAEVKGFIQSKFNPKFLFFTGGPNDPSFKDQVGATNINGIFSTGDWFYLDKTTGNAAFVKAYVAKYGVAPAKIDSAAAEAYATGQVVELVAQRTGKVDNATIIKSLHKGTWPTVEGNLSWNADGSPNGEDIIVQWVNQQLAPVFPAHVAVTSPISKPPWGG